MNEPLDDLVEQEVELPSGPLRLLQPREVAELPDEGEIQWAPVAPYWAVLWRSGVALAEKLDRGGLQGRRVVELGCGLGVPSLAAARAGANVLATDIDPDALRLLERNAQANDLELETAVIDWANPEPLIARAPFDLVVAADLLYEDTAVDHLRSLMPKLAKQALLADPGRPAGDALLDRLDHSVETQRETRGVVRLYRLTFDG
jgi:predicted nicotinamide N-methyase